MDQVQTLLSLQLPSVVHAHVPATGAVEHAEQSCLYSTLLLRDKRQKC